LLPDQRHVYENVAMNRSTVLIDLTKDFFSGYSARRRTYLRKEQEKFPELQELSPSAHLTLFQGLYMETMRRLQAEKFYYFNERYFSALVLASGCRLWGLRYGGGEIQAAMVSLEVDSSGIVEYHLGAYHHDGSSRPMELLIHLVAERYRERGFRKFFLGGGRSSRENDGLLQFKRGFSRHELPFRIGANVFLREKYQALRDHPGFNPCSDRVIFYRR
jgi:lipid II:glycine glycyltransferase (peptidoglycan interpeptide bridge formation enzyme)